MAISLPKMTPPDAAVRRSSIALAARMLRQFVDVQTARRALRAPQSLPLLAIDTTVSCNARCGMCAYPTHYPANESALSTDELRAVIDDAAALGALVISLGGGEPFLRTDAEEVIGHIDGYGITSLVHSNGSLLTPARRERLAAHRHLALVLSLDSHRRTTHDELRGLTCFDRVVAAARHLARHAPHVRLGFTFTVTAHNFCDMLGVMRLACDLGVRTVRFTPVHDNLQHRFGSRDDARGYAVAPQDLPALRDEVERVLAFAREHGMITNSQRFLRSVPDHFRGRVEHRCFAGFFYAYIDPSGNVFPCYDHHAGLNVRRDGGLAGAWRSPMMDVLRRRVVDCRHRCWNVGTAEPSLRMDLRTLTGQLPQLLRETMFFLR